MAPTRPKTCSWQQPGCATRRRRRKNVYYCTTGSRASSRNRPSPPRRCSSRARPTSSRGACATCSTPSRPPGCQDLDEAYHDAKADLVDAEQAALRSCALTLRWRRRSRSRSRWRRADAAAGDGAARPVPGERRAVLGRVPRGAAGRRRGRGRRRRARPRATRAPGPCRRAGRGASAPRTRTWRRRAT